MYLGQVALIYPLFVVFTKYLTGTKQNFLGKQAFFSGICLAITYLLAPANTIFDLIVIFSLIATQYEILRYIKYIFIWVMGLIFVWILGSHMTSLWYNSLTANASFVFFENFVFGAFYAIILNELFVTLNNLTNKSNKKESIRANEIKTVNMK